MGMNFQLFIGVLGTCLTLISASDDAPIITTEEGKVSGIVEKAVNGNSFYSYYGIPYASPPLGELRFKDPQEHPKWEGVRDCSKMPPMCLQVRFVQVMAGVRVTPEELEGEEDCLFLNVFTPKDATEPSKSGLPVMVYIHGGGWFSGGAEEYLPHALLSKDIVLVVIQYRLGFLGFLSTEDSVMPGNFGLKDQTFSLTWVQRNIHHFGGDPSKVTIFGESAGGASIHYQMLTPKSKGLFRNAIMQSGSAFGPWALKEDHAEIAKEVGNLVGCSLEDGSQSFLKCMRSVDARQIGVGVQELVRWFVFPLMAVPRVDGDYLPDYPVNLMKEGRQNKVNLMAGVTADEGVLFSFPIFSRPDLASSLISDFENNGPYSVECDYEVEAQTIANKYYNYYVGGRHIDVEHVRELTKMSNDRHFMVPHDLLSDLHARMDGVSMYRYEVVHQGEFSASKHLNPHIPGKWVCHGDELYYIFRGGPLLQPFDNPSGPPSDISTDEDLRMREVMLSLWTNFAATGNPTPDDSLGFQWKPNSPGDLSYLAISPEAKMTKDSRKEVRDFANSLPTKFNRLLHPHLVQESVPKSEL